MLAIWMCAMIFSCSVEHHLGEIEKHTEKAKEMGAVFSPDTIWYYKIKYKDSLIYIDSDTIIVPVAVIDSMPYPVETIKYIPISRQERLHLRDKMKFQARMYEDSLKYLNKHHRRAVKAYKDSLKYAKQMHNSDNRIARAESNDSWWKFWLILGISIGLIGAFCVFKYVPYLKKLLD